MRFNFQIYYTTHIWVLQYFVTHKMKDFTKVVRFSNVMRFQRYGAEIVLFAVIASLGFADDIH